MIDNKARAKIWDLPLRMFHWTLVLTITVAFLSAEEESALNQWHVLSGWVAAVLISFRLIWGFVGGEHSRFSDFIRPSRIVPHISGIARRRGVPSLGHNPLGAVAVVILLTLIIITIWTGAFGGEGAEELHEVVAWALLAMIALHIFAVIVMSLLERENLVRAMITGDKPASRHPGAEDAKAPRGAALVVAAAVVATATYLILQVDPAAFTLRSAEAFEHRGEIGAEVASADDDAGNDD